MISHFDKNKTIELVVISLLIFALMIGGSFIVNRYISTKATNSSIVSNNSQIKAVDTVKVPIDTLKKVLPKAPKDVKPVPTKKVVVTIPKVVKQPVKQAAPVIVVKSVPMICTPSFNGQFLILINNYRKSKGLNALTINSKLNDSACGHSTWMSQNNILTHTGVNGSTPWDRCKAAGMNCTGEIVATNPEPFANELFNQWKNSPAHNAIMLGKYTQIGIGLSGMYGTADFR